MRVLVHAKPKPGTIGPRLRDELIANGAGRRPLIEGPVVLRLRFLFKIADAIGAGPVTRGPTLPSLVRAALDELPGLIYVEEGQVVQLQARKEYANVDGLELQW